MQKYSKNWGWGNTVKWVEKFNGLMKRKGGEGENLMLLIERKGKRREIFVWMESSHREGKEDGGGGYGRKLSVQH